MTTGELIKAKREELGLSLIQLSRRCNPTIRDTSLRKYEKGDRKPKIETLQTIADALGCYIYELIPRDEAINNKEVFDAYIKGLDNHIDKLYVQRLVGTALKLNEHGREALYGQAVYMTTIKELLKDNGNEAEKES